MKFKRTLNGEWQTRPLGGEWLPAEVPGCNYLDLLRSGKIPDPFYGTNEKDVYWVAEKDWEYRRVFSVSEKELKAGRVFLCAERLDTVCRICINGRQAASAENCHISYRFEVKDFLKAGENELRIEFDSPVEYVKRRQARVSCPFNGNGQTGIPHIRKPQCHFGWDWGPVLPPSGISGDIGLEFVTGAELGEIEIKQEHHDGAVDLHVGAETLIYNEKPCEVEATLASPDGESSAQTGEKVCFHIEKPELWWTHDLIPGQEPKLYTLTVRIRQGGETLDEKRKSIGLRTLALDRSRDGYGESFRFVLNGVPLFVRGANCIPGDSFITRFTEDKLKYMLDAARFSNMNMLRVWGGGYYGSDRLYELCDEMGILIWQDFAFACQPYPFFDEDFLQNVMEEVRSNVLRLRHHASLALWCGNNEIEAMSPAWAARRRFVEWTEKFFYRLLEPQIRKFDAVTPYIPGSPCGLSHCRGVDADNVGDTHLWGVWHGLQPLTYYRGRLTRFCSEFGFESLPDIKTVRKFAGEGPYSLSGEVFGAHQKCRSGNDKMIYYIASRFRLPKKFEDFVYLSQLAQRECVRDATEHWRRNKGRCNGAMYWQLNDCWPVCSWASLDYYGGYKALQYAARHFNAPLCVSVEDGKEKTRVFALNDSLKDVRPSVRYSIFDFERGVRSHGEVPVSLGSGESREVFVFDMEKLRRRFDLKRTGLLAELLLGGGTVSRSVVLFGAEKNLRLPKARLTKTVSFEKDRLAITVSSDVFAHLVRVESDFCTQPFSDNYFDLLPGEEKTVALPLPADTDPEALAASLSLFCCTDVVPGKSRTSDRLRAALVLLQPVNFGGWLWYRSAATEYRID